ncbi:hypothetical protein AC249_AIPGENE1773 [Exaiptasia diaphana]|nr:hypothetical protein AC249_AIPGENE1773 [Exaiptasia diaphana]
MSIGIAILQSMIPLGGADGFHNAYVPASCKSQLVASEKFRKKELSRQGILSWKKFVQEQLFRRTDSVDSSYTIVNRGEWFGSILNGLSARTPRGREI